MKLSHIFCASALAFMPLISSGQQLTFHSSDDGSSLPHGSSAVMATQPAVSDQQPLTHRWFDLETLAYSARYRNTVNVDGRRLFEFGQEKYVAAGAFKLDEEGKYTLDFHASTGRYFNWSYADLIGGQYKDSVVAARAYKTPAEKAALAYAYLYDPNAAEYKAGIPSRGGYFYPRQLFASASPVKQVTFEYGSLAIEHGQNSEITSFDDDGYISGGRVRVKDAQHFFFDQIAGTWAYLGSPLAPDFFARMNDLTKYNYGQYLVEKQLAKPVAASVDFTELNGTHTFREALSYSMPQSSAVDAARFELYQRTNTVTIAGKDFDGGSGFAVSAHTRELRKVGFEGGYADIDERYAVYGGSIYLAEVGFALNGDSYETGKRGFAKADVKLGHGVSAFGFYTHSVVPITIGHNQQGLNAGLNFDMKSIINSQKHVF